MMDGGCYMPNNPAHWGDMAPAPGLAGGGSSPPSTRCTDAYPQCWPAPDDMATFSLSALDLDPFFNCSPTTNIKNEYSGLKERSGSGDMPDVLLTLKHPLGQMSPSAFGCSGPTACHQAPSASLSYTVHPQMIQMSPSGGSYGAQYCSGLDQSGMFAGPSSQHGVNMFPSMSVNVSMNIPMPTYPPPPDPTLHPPMSCSQMPWGNGSSGASPVYCQPGGLLSPQSYSSGPPGATYSFTADFRPQAISTIPTIGSQEVMFKPQRRSSCQHSSGKMSPCSDEDGPQTNLCRICGKTYARPSTLKTHLRTHSGEKPYRCDECNKSFSQAANLTAHVRTHSGEKPFRCPICDRRFSQSSSVTTHMRTHSGERPYRCRLCKKAFSDSSTLTKHLRIHSGEKPYQCKLCLLRFSQSGNLNRHMRVHGSNPPV